MITPPHFDNDERHLSLLFAWMLVVAAWVELLVFATASDGVVLACFLAYWMNRVIVAWRRRRE